MFRCLSVLQHAFSMPRTCSRLYVRIFDKVEDQQSVCSILPLLCSAVERLPCFDFGAILRTLSLYHTNLPNELADITFCQRLSILTRSELRRPLVFFLLI